MFNKLVEIALNTRSNETKIGLRFQFVMRNSRLVFLNSVNKLKTLPIFKKITGVNNFRNLRYDIENALDCLSNMV